VSCIWLVWFCWRQQDGGTAVCACPPVCGAVRARSQEEDLHADKHTLCWCCSYVLLQQGGTTWCETVWQANLLIAVQVEHWS
jgi:hypothetical protein